MKTYYAVDGDGTEVVSNYELYRNEGSGRYWVTSRMLVNDNLVELPSGTIQQLFGVVLTYDDAPIIIEWNKEE